MESAAIGASLRFDAHGSYVLFATAASLAYTGPGIALGAALVFHGQT